MLSGGQITVVGNGHRHHSGPDLRDHGGMLAVAYTDFIQMIVLVIGLSYIAWVSAGLAGGADKVFDLARERSLFTILPEPNVHGWLFFISAAITMMSVEFSQQDVFQRVMSAKDAPTARNGAVIGGLCYLAFAFVPMFIVTSSLLIMPDEALPLLQRKRFSEGAAEDDSRTDAVLCAGAVFWRASIRDQIVFLGNALGASH